MTYRIFTIVLTILSLFASAFRIGVYYNQSKTSTTEDSTALDILPIVPYGIAGSWGLVVIISNGVMV